MPQITIDLDDVPYQALQLLKVAGKNRNGDPATEKDVVEAGIMGLVVKGFGAESLLRAIDAVIGELGNEDDEANAE